MHWRLALVGWDCPTSSVDWVHWLLELVGEDGLTCRFEGVLCLDGCIVRSTGLLLPATVERKRKMKSLSRMELSRELKFEKLVYRVFGTKVKCIH